MSYFPEPHINKISVEAELDLPNYTTKSDLLKFAKKLI